MGLSFATCGSIIAWHRPRNPIGWLFLGSGVAQATTAVIAPLAQVLLAAHAPSVGLRVLLTALQLVVAVGHRTRDTGRAAAVPRRPGAVARGGAGWWSPSSRPRPCSPSRWPPSPTREPGLPPPYLTLPFYADLQPLWTAVEIRGLLAVGLGLVCLGLRYRRGPRPNAGSSCGCCWPS